MNKEKGLGAIESRPPIHEEDLTKITAYFEQIMQGKWNPQALQEIVFFYVLYYMCWWGRENLRAMSTKTFAISTDSANNLQFVYQQMDEADKNHSYVWW